MKTGLLLVDIQNDYFPGGRMELVGINEASAKAKDLLSLFRENQWPTFHIQHISIGKGATFFLPDTSGVEIHESIKPLPEDVVIQKHYPNSFRETDLYEQLSAKKDHSNFIFLNSTSKLFSRVFASILKGQGIPSCRRKSEYLTTILFSLCSTT